MKTQTMGIETSAGRGIGQILDLLKVAYGVPAPQNRGDPVSVLVQTILSQNTSDINSRKAFRSLLACFKRWEDVVDADVDTIANCIRSGGLGKIQARRIKQTLGQIMQARGRLELDFLGRLPVSKADGSVDHPRRQTAPGRGIIHGPAGFRRFRLQ